MGHGQQISCLNFRPSKSSGKRTSFWSSNLLIFRAEKYKQTNKRLIYPNQYIYVGCTSVCYPKQVFRDCGEINYFCQISRGRILLISEVHGAHISLLKVIFLVYILITQDLWPPIRHLCISVPATFWHLICRKNYNIFSANLAS